VSLFAWVAYFGLFSLACAWVIFWDGDERLLGVGFACYLLGRHVGTDPAVVRVAVGCGWLLYGLWFAVGLFVPELRWP
jgi:hypothetical protein